MSLVTSDIHGNYPKAKAFLDYRPEEEHIFAGDYFDSYHATDDDIYQSAKLIFESNAVKLYGNHDMVYLNNAHSYMRCSGNRRSPIFNHLMESHKNDLQAAVIRDSYVITHAGVHPALCKPFENKEEMVKHFNEVVSNYVTCPVVPETLPNLWNIGSCRGGWQQFGGIFWLDYRSENVEKSFNQCFGHSHGKNCKEQIVGKTPHKKHVCVDADEFFCWNTATEEFEDFMPEEFKASRELLEKPF